MVFYILISHQAPWKNSVIWGKKSEKVVDIHRWGQKRGRQHHERRIHNQNQNQVGKPDETRTETRFTNAWKLDETLQRRTETAGIR